MDPHDGRGAGTAVRDAMGDETVSSNGEPGTKEAEALAAALNRSAERVQTLWFSFLTFMLYLAIATGTTTHRMLFLEEPLNLPVLNIKLPLLGFYILTPIIFVVFHFYMLLNLVLLARTADGFKKALERALPEDGEPRENFRMRIENTLFVQLLVGCRREREGINAKFLSLMALITLALAPVALMLMLEIKFLPYHSWQITWMHRGLLALDLMLVWTLWPGYRSGWGVRLRPKRSWKLVWPGVLSAVALVYVVAVATFPEEQVYVATNWLHGSYYRELSTGGISSQDRPKWYGWIAPISSLVLGGEDLIDDAKLKQIIKKNEGSANTLRWVPTLSLAERDLTGANLSGADVQHVDFSRAILKHANLIFAWAKNAHFDNAQLQGAALFGAQLQRASLDSTQLQAAVLDFAQLQGANLRSAQLQGASLGGAGLQGASLFGAQLQGTLLNSAQLQGADLDWANLQGASLDGAKLQGASLGGMNFKEQLQSASFVDVCAWRADARQAAWGETRVARPETRRIAKAEDKSLGCDWTVGSFEALKRLIAEEAPEGDTKRAAMERIGQRLDPAEALEGEEGMAEVWADRESSSPPPEVYEKSLAEQWRETGCAADGAPYVVRSLLFRLENSNTSVSFRGMSFSKSIPFTQDSPDPPKLAAAFLTPDCAGARGLSDDEIAKLKEIAAKAAPAAPQAPKP